MRSQGILWIDHHPGEHLYRHLRVPDNWVVVRPNQWGSIAQGMNWVVEQYPDASQYGWLADDTYPRTRGWDRKLEDAAGRTHLSYANDLWLSTTPDELEALERGGDLSSGLCWAGDLVRAVGWWALPGTRQAGIDTAWTAIVGKLNRHRYLNDVIVEHKNYKTGKRAPDAADSWLRGNRNYVQADIDTRNLWVQSQDYWDTLERVSALCPLEER